MLNIDYILELWLKQVPTDTALFCNYAIIFTMCQTFSHCMYITMLATGDIKKYQLIVGTLSLMAFPVAYVFFKLGMSAEWGYISMIIFSVLCLIARLILLKDMLPGFNPPAFIMQVIMRSAYCVLPVVVVMTIIHSMIGEVIFTTFICESLLCVILSVATIYIIGLSSQERNIIKRQLIKMLRKWA